MSCAPPASPAPWGETLVAATLAATLAAWTFRGALRYGFSQDDWQGLARASGLAERLPLGWRWLSHQAFWDQVVGPLGTSAAAAHVVVLAMHAIASVLLVVLLTRRLGAPAGLIGGVFFATHFAQFTACYWLSANGDVLATLLSLGVALAFLANGRLRWLGVPLFMLALLAKESVLGLPFALGAIALFAPRSERPRDGLRDPLLWALAAVSLTWVALLRPGSSSAALGDAAYAIDLRAVLPNLLTYGAWTLNAWLPTVRDVSDAVAPAQYPWAFGLFAAWFAACMVPALRRRAVLAGLIAFVAMLLPVLPLAAHTYHYYLVAALPAAALLVAALADALLARAPRAMAWTAAGVVAVLLGLNGAALAGRIEHAPFQAEGLRADPIVDRALIAENALGDLRAAALPAGASLRLWSPQSQNMAAAAGVPPEREGYYESNLRAALLDGLAVRVGAPQLQTVTFVRAYDPADSLAWWAVLRYDGHLRATRPGEIAQLLTSTPR